MGAYAGKENVYIFIDDLDRCEYSKAADLMQALFMLLSSAPRIALIIGLDRNKVAAAMAARQHKLLPYLYKVKPTEAYTLGMEYGQRFIEKFIQVSYILPKPESNGLKAMINPEINPEIGPVPESEKSPRVIEIVTGKDDSNTLNDIIDMADEVFDHNPRNVKQFVNMFRLQAFISNESGLFGSLRVTRGTGRPLTIPQLGKYVALCMRWPEVVERASDDLGLLGRLEDSLKARPDGTKSLGVATDSLLGFRPDHSLVRLLNFGLPDSGFSLAGVDFHLLSCIAPARSQDNGAPQGSVTSSSRGRGYEPVGRSK